MTRRPPDWQAAQARSLFSSVSAGLKMTRSVRNSYLPATFPKKSACLYFLLEIAREKSFLVTYNGKAFDVGLLSTRFILNRLPDGLTAMPNLDLLHPARRLFGHRLENNRLSTMEKDIIGFHRYGDIPGSEIPQRYFDWLRYRDPRLLADVFNHNRLDVISMAALSVHLAEILSSKPHMANETNMLTF